MADIDNDGSAEILVVSNQYNPGPDYQCLRAIRDIEDRWIQSRSIWNQHTYHVSNVREDGTIPQFEPKSWEGLNLPHQRADRGRGICDPAG